MNFIHGHLVIQSGKLFFKEKNQGTVQITLGDLPSAAPFIGKEIILGIRPESCELVESGQTPPVNSFQAVVEIVEPMGAETFFHLQTGAHTIISRSQASVDQRQAGHYLCFAIAPENVHLFDPDSTLRIV